MWSKKGRPDSDPCRTCRWARVDDRCALHKVRRGDACPEELWDPLEEIYAPQGCNASSLAFCVESAETVLPRIRPTEVLADGCYHIQARIRQRSR